MRSPRPMARAVAAMLLALPPLAQATNGMLLEGYGPIATGMGGASTAVDNGVAAATNNPSTLQIDDGAARLDLALGLLGPSVSSQAGPMKADSGGTAYVMPALGYARRSGPLSVGVAVFAQGGMGTEYGADSFLALGSGASVRSELGVGRLIVPVAWQATPAWSVGGSIDYVWASLDLRMAASGADLSAMTTAASGNLAMALPALAGAPWARVDFSDDSRYSGAARASGVAFKLGTVFQASPQWRFGASYHSRTDLADMKTSGRAAALSAPAFADAGRVSVHDFQMPEEVAVGVAWQATPGLLVAADLKHIGWAAVMDSLRMTYDSAGMGGSVSFAMQQHWRDQTVLQIGASQRLGPDWVLRAGLNLANNPVPATWVNPLFPAIVRNHVSFGGGYAFGPADELNASVVYAPSVNVDTPAGLVISHRQLNAQLMYSHRF